jgi:hypothetical protein
MWLTFPWIVTNGIRTNLVIFCGIGALQHDMGPNEDVKNLIGRYYGTLNSEVSHWVDRLKVLDGC